MKYLFIRFLFFVIFFGNFILFAQENPPADSYLTAPINAFPPSPEAALFEKFDQMNGVNASGLPDINIPLYELEYKDITIPISLKYNASGIRVNDISTTVGLNWALINGGAIFRTVYGRPDENNGWINDVQLKDSLWMEKLIFDEENYQQDLEAFYKYGRDISPDIYNFNLPGLSGKFILHDDKIMIISCESAVKIIKQDLEFIIYDKNGIKYLFSPIETTTVTYVDTDINFPIFNFDYPLLTNTGWFLTEIELLNGEKIIFNYENYEYISSLNSTSSIKQKDPSGCNPYAEIISTNIMTTTHIKTGAVKSIITPKEKVEFSYSEDPELSILKKKLDNIKIISDTTGDTINKISLTHEKYVGDSRLKLLGVEFFGSSDLSFKKYEFRYEESPLPPFGSPGQDIFGFQNTNTLKHMIPHSDDPMCKSLDYPLNFPLTPANREVDTLLIKRGILEEIIFPTGGRIKFTYEANKIGNIFGPGVRLKNQQLFNEDNILEKTEIFEYDNLFSFPYLHEASRYCYFQNLHYLVNGFYQYVSYSPNLYKFKLPNKGVYSGLLYGKITTKEVDGLIVNGIKEDYYDYIQDFNAAKPYLSKTVYKNQQNKLIKQYEYFRSFENTKYKSYLLTTSWTEHNWYFTKCYSHFGGNGLDYFYWNIPSIGSVKNITKEFLSNDTLTQTKTLFFDNQRLPYLEVFKNSKGDSILTEYKYQKDYSVEFDSGIKNAIGLPIDVRKYVKINNNERGLLFGKINSFNSYGKVTHEYLFETSYPDSTITWQPDVLVNSDFSLENSFLYDQNQNLIQIDSKKEGVSVYLWGQDDNVLLAVLENIKWADIPDGLTDSISKFENFQKNLKPEERNEVNRLNESLREEYTGIMMTTFTHHPFLGITSVCDRRGQTTFYEYDDYGRLRRIRDNDDMIIEEYLYHYSNQ